MKIKIILAVFVVLFVGCNVISKREMEAAREYNDKLIGYTLPITEQINAIFGSTKSAIAIKLKGFKTDSLLIEINDNFKDLIININGSLDSVSKMDEFDKKIKFKEVSMNFLMACKESLNNEFRQLLNIVEKEMSYSNRVECLRLINIVFEKLGKFEKETKQIQKQFAEKYMFQINHDSQK